MKIAMDAGSAISPDFARLLWFTIALAVVLIAVAVYRRRSPLDLSQTPAPVLGKIVYNDAPTVRVTDSQHFDRLRKSLRLSVGEHADIVHAHPVIGPRFRVALNDVVMNGASEAAHLSVVFNGNQVSCGPLAKEIGYNEFYVPRAARDESRSAVFFYNESGNALEFMRIKVTSIDASTDTVDLEVMQMRGNWPGSEG